jgi:hypothetical protein
MKDFKLVTPEWNIIRFAYDEDAPITSRAFASILPFSRVFMHARTSGEEIWINDAQPLNIIQENASVFTMPGEVVYGPLYPSRAKTANSMGIYYGEGRGLDSCNIFARVFDEDMEALAALGVSIWKGGECELAFSALDHHL